MTDKDAEFEKRLYDKVVETTRIEEARRLGIPSPVKIPKKKRKSSSGGFCGQCMQHNLVGTEDRHGMWHYRCPYCISHSNPKGPDPCPRCGCTAHERICGKIPIDSHFGERLKSEMETIFNPFRPDVILFRCLNCSFEWDTPEFEKYLLIKTVRSVLSNSEFNKQ